MYSLHALVVGGGRRISRRDISLNRRRSGSPPALMRAPAEPSAMDAMLHRSYGDRAANGCSPKEGCLGELTIGIPGVTSDVTGAHVVDAALTRVPGN